jgi:hypothetical protein
MGNSNKRGLGNRSYFMPITIGTIFRQIVKELLTQDKNPNNCLKNPNSDLRNPNYDINNPSSYINNQNSFINDLSNNQNNKEQRRNVLRELIQTYLSNCLSKEEAERLIAKYIP